VGLAGGSRLYTWRGSDASLKPIMFISHYDVVPGTLVFVKGGEGEGAWHRLHIRVIARLKLY